MPGCPAAERLARAGLSRAGEPGLTALTRLVDRVGPVAAWQLLRNADPRGIGPDLAGAATRAGGTDPERDLEVMERLGGSFLCPGDPGWPAGFDQLDRAGLGPLGLWVRGSGNLAELAERSVCIVGSRAATEYGLYVAGELAAGLADRGYAVLSGGAYGIDAAAHRGALAVGGRTIAVLACGVDVDYPAENVGLFQRIAAEGLVVSEHPPGSAAFRVRFLQRNRLIAAMSLGTVVVEAAERSGALSTAGHAARLGRPVMAVPGPVTSLVSAGCHRLIREFTATLVTGVAEVVEVVGRLGTDLAPLPHVERPGDGLPDEAARVLDAVPVRNAAPPEAIAATACVAPANVLGCLGLLAGLGLVEQVATGWRLKGGRRLPAPDRDQPMGESRQLRLGGR